MKKNSLLLKIFLAASFFFVSFVSTAQTVTIISASSQFWEEPATNLNDNNAATKWNGNSNVPSVETPTWAVYQYDAPYAFNTAKLISHTNATYTNRTPRDFKIQGSTDGTTWVDLNSQTSQQFAASEEKIYSFANATAYTYYRILITKNNNGFIGANWEGGDNTELGELHFASVVGPDVTKPSIPLNLNGIKSLSTVTLSWSASSDNIAVTGYDVFKDGVLAGSTTTATSLLINGLTQGQTFLFTVKAKDAAANISDASTVLSVTMPTGLYYVTASSEFPQYNESATNLFDLDNATKWTGSHDVVVSGSAPEWVVVEYASGQVFKKYIMTNAVGNDVRAPKDWTFEGSNNGTAWTLLDTKTAQDFVAQTPNTYTFTNTTSYTFYKLTITATHSTDSYFGKFANLAELSFSNEVTTGVSKNTIDNVTVYSQSGSAIVDLTSLKGATQVSILDAKGSLVKTVKSVGNEKLNINLQNKGIYLVRILNGAKSFSNKVILN